MKSFSSIIVSRYIILAVWMDGSPESALYKNL